MILQFIFSDYYFLTDWIVSAKIATLYELLFISVSAVCGDIQ